MPEMNDRLEYILQVGRNVYLSYGFNSTNIIEPFKALGRMFDKSENNLQKVFTRGKGYILTYAVNLL